MTPEAIAAIAAATGIARDLTVGGVLLLVIVAWLRGYVMRTHDHERAVADLKAAFLAAIGDLKATQAETLARLKESHDALLVQVRSELAASHRREDEWKMVALEQRQTMREAVNVASNTGRG